MVGLGKAREPVTIDIEVSPRMATTIEAAYEPLRVSAQE
jgi:hypothetical protein